MAATKLKVVLRGNTSDIRCLKKTYIGMSRLFRDVTRSLVRTSVRKQSVKAATSFTDADLQNARPFKEIPGPTGIRNIPYLGSMFFFKPFGKFRPEAVHHLLESFVEKYGTLVRCYMPGPTVMVADPADVEVVMRNEGKYPGRQSFVIADLYYEAYGRPKSLANMQGAEWHARRSVLNPTMLHAKSAQRYLPAQNEVANTLVERLKRDMSAKERDEMFYRYACESISVVVFNTRLGFLDKDVDQYPERLQTLIDIRTIFDAYFKTFSIPPFILKRFNMKIKRDHFEAMERIIRFCEGYYQTLIDGIEKRQADGTLEPEEHNFILSLLMTEKLSIEEMSSTAIGLFIAGTDSTANSLQMVLYNMARNPDKQEQVNQEIRDVIGRHEDLSAKDLSQMRYMLASVKESLRMINPTAVGAQRFLPNDIILQGYRIPAMTNVLTLTREMVKMEKYFPNPHEFLPERWLRDETGQRETSIPTMAAHPFGFGVRQCIGRRFAEQEIYLAIVKILQNFRVSLAPDQKELDLMYVPFVTTKDPIKFIFRHRD